MARPIRIEYDGAVYHITSRGNARKRIYKDDTDRLRFLDLLREVNQKYNWLCHAYCLMDNHYLNRLGLSDIFPDQVKQQNKEARNKLMYNAIIEHGYSQKEMADYLGLHYSTVSRLIRAQEKRAK